MSVWVLPNNSNYPLTPETVSSGPDHMTHFKPSAHTRGYFPLTFQLDPRRPLHLTIYTTHALAEQPRKTRPPVSYSKYRGQGLICPYADLVFNFVLISRGFPHLCLLVAVLDALFLKS